MLRAPTGRSPASRGEDRMAFTPRARALGGEAGHRGSGAQGPAVTPRPVARGPGAGGGEEGRPPPRGAGAVGGRAGHRVSVSKDSAWNRRPLTEASTHGPSPVAYWLASMSEMVWSLAATRSE